jgi:hypothetical protein
MLENEQPIETYWYGIVREVIAVAELRMRCSTGCATAARVADHQRHTRIATELSIYTDARRNRRGIGSRCDRGREAITAAPRLCRERKLA